MNNEFALLNAIASVNDTSSSLLAISEYKTSIMDGSFEYSSDSKEIFVPITAIQNASSLEAIVLYLKDILDMKFSVISKLLNRDQRTIWATYSKAKQKSGKNITSKIISMTANTSINIPLSIFRSRRLSILESIVLFLKNDHNLSFNQISEILGKNYRTIWTIYRRALKKMEDKA